jgi:two-component sensor histidine kinase
MTEMTIEQSLSDGHLFMHELTHRLNNEFASVISAISLTAARSRNREVRDALIGVTELLHHSADVHRALQMPENHSDIDAGRNLERLCQSLRRSKLNSLNIKLVIEARPVQMPADRCWRLGMIVYELITNAARHAFAGTGGEVRVGLGRSGSFVKCKVADDGSAPANIRAGRGLRIIEELVQSLDGTIVQEFGRRGSISTITFRL